MSNAGFYIYLLFTVSWFLHLTARLPVLGIIRFDFLIVVVLFLMKFLKRQEDNIQTQDDCGRRLNILVLTILLITPFAEWPGSVVARGLPNFIKAIVFLYFTIWFINSQKKLYIFIATFVCCQTFRFMEPLYLHITEGYWGSRASMANWESMDRLSGAPLDTINPNGLAFVVITVLPFLICFFKVNKLCKIYTFIFVPPGLYVLLLTGSRSGFLATILLVLFLFYKSKNKKVFVIVTVIAVFLLSGFMTDSLTDRYRSIFDSDAKNAATAEGRFEGWSKDFKVGLRKPFFGHGLGTSLEANANYGSYAKPSHNLYTEVFQELGIVGLIFFLMYLWSIIKSLNKKETDKDKLSVSSLVPVKSAFITLTVTTLFFSFASYGLSSYEWYFIGGCVGAINNLLSQQTDNQMIPN